MRAMVGLEVHVQLKTGRKLLCGCSDAYGAPGNTCPYCTERRGSPMLDANAVELAVRAALLLGCEVPGRSRFVRKVNRSPYLPGGYQVTQFDEPIGRNGSYLGIPIERVQLEEDAARPLRAGGIDYNRSGIALVEIVTAPVFTGGKQAREWTERVRLSLRFSGVTDGRMEQGSLRADASISLDGGAKVEVKGLASLGALERAVEGEIARQSEALRSGAPTRAGQAHWSQREGRIAFLGGAYAYRWEGADDLAPICLSREAILRANREMGEEREACIARLMACGVAAQDAERLARYRGAIAYLDRATASGAPAAQAARLLVSEGFRFLASQEERVRWEMPMPPDLFARVALALSQGAISFDGAKEAIGRALAGEKGIALCTAKGVEGSELRSLAEAAVAALPDAARSFRNGKAKALSAMVGHMVRGDGVNPRDARAALEEVLARSYVSRETWRR